MSHGPWAKVESRIDLDPRYAGGLAGLGEFSHVVVVFHLDRIPPFDPAKQLARNPRGMESLAPVGVFAQRTKFRPNPIGVTAVELVSVDERGITVRGLDATLKRAIEERARENGRSMEAEVRTILEATILPSEPQYGLGRRIHELFADAGGLDGNAVERLRGENARPASFAE